MYFSVNAFDQKWNYFVPTIISQSSFLEINVLMCDLEPYGPLEQHLFI